MNDFFDMDVAKRLQKIYERLVDETGQRTTLRNERENHLLKHLLELVEFIRQGGEDPLDKWFDPAEVNTVAPNEFARLRVNNSDVPVIMLPNLANVSLGYTLSLEAEAKTFVYCVDGDTMLLSLQRSATTILLENDIITCQAILDAENERKIWLIFPRKARQ